MPSSSCRPSSSRSGAVLLFVLVCLLALSGFVILSSGKASREALEARRLAAEYQAALLAESLLEQARALILEDKDTLTDTLEDPWADPVIGETYAMTIEPCNARLNLNEAATDLRTQETIKRLLEKRNIDTSALDYLLDWLDADTDEERITGSEQGAYVRKWPQYTPRNGDVTVPCEILLVQGFEDLDRQWVEGFFTVWSEKKININFVSQELFEAYLPEIANAWTQVEQWRLDEGFRTKSDLTEAIPQLEGDDDLWKTVSDSTSLSGNLFLVSIEVQLPFIYERRRYIIERNPILPDKSPDMVMGSIITTISTD